MLGMLLGLLGPLDTAADSFRESPPLHSTVHSGPTVKLSEPLTTESKPHGGLMMQALSTQSCSEVVVQPRVEGVIFNIP